MSDAPTLLFIIGPPAVGKMAVGHEIAARTGLRLFHNHLTIEPVLRFFDFGTAPFERLVSEFRRSVFEEVAASDLPGLIFTYVCAFDLPGDLAELASYAVPFRRRASRILHLELHATQEQRLQRTVGEFRLAEKPSQRDVVAAQRRLVELDRAYRLNSAGEFDGVSDYLRLDNTHLSAGRAAELAINRFALPSPAAT
ncbi:MAG: AAA family ATPase [Actinomycetota bacterium]|nr:AAA family ATPase [Actinomycetota bacterium]